MRILLFFLLIKGAVLAQQPPDLSSVCKEEMKKLSYMVGRWKGEVSYRRSPGPAEVLQQEETIGYELGGVALLIHGTGKKQDKVAFQALGIINYDPIIRQFKFRSFVMEGYSTDAYFKIVEENNFEWGFEIPNTGKIRYTITLNPAQKSWREEGEFSSDGTTWMKTVELTLNKME